jgi:transposase
MLSFHGQARIFLHRDPVCMRNSFEGLCALVQAVFAVELTTGAYFAFFNRRRDCVKVLYWDGDGIAIWYKRLEKGSFIQHALSHGLIERREFLMLLEGISPQRLQKRYKVA